MSGKRSSQYQYNEKTLQAKQCQAIPQNQNNSKPISERKFYKIKNEKICQNDNKIKHKMNAIDEIQKKQGQQQKNKTIEMDGQKLFSTQMKNDGKNNLFDLKEDNKLNLDSNNKDNQKKGLFDDKNNQKSNQSLNHNSKIKEGLFDLKNDKSNLDFNHKNNLKGGLFNTKQGQISNLFSNPNYNFKGSLFDDKNPQKQSIFNFNLNGPPPINYSMSNNKGDDYNSGDSEQLEKLQNLQNDPSKGEQKYEYSQKCEVLYKIKLLKYKKNNGQLIQNVQLSILMDKQYEIYYLVIKLIEMKNTIFNGIILKNKSNINLFSKKQTDLLINVFKIQNDNLILYKLKCQVQTIQQGRQLKSILQKIIFPTND